MAGLVVGFKGSLLGFLGGLEVPGWWISAVVVVLWLFCINGFAFSISSGVGECLEVSSRGVMLILSFFAS